MIKYEDGEFLELMPSLFKEKADVAAISYAFKMAVASLLVDQKRTYLFSDINNASEELLDLMALELNAPYYSEDLDLDTKRSLVKNAIIWQSRAGTKKAVQDLVTLLFGEGEIVEWYDFPDGPGTPGTFDITTSAQLTPWLYEQMAKAINRVKNESSHIMSITATQDIKKPFTHGTGYSWDETGTITNDVNINDKDQAYPIGQYFALGEVSELLEDVVLFRKELERDVPMPVEVGMAVSFDTQTILFETLGESEIEQDTRVGAGVSSDSLSVLM